MWKDSDYDYTLLNSVIEGKNLLELMFNWENMLFSHNLINWILVFSQWTAH
jgi:hypothetical protein